MIALRKNLRQPLSLKLSSEEYRIEAAEGHSLKELSAIEIAAGGLFPEQDLPANLREASLSLEFLAQAAALGHLLLASRVGLDGWVGFAALSRIDGDLHLKELAVRPEHGRRGVGRRLLEAVIDQARERGESAITLTTFRHLRWNAPFYAKLGFRALDTDEIGSELAETLEGEAKEGLDPAKRIAMRLVL